MEELAVAIEDVVAEADEGFEGDGAGAEAEEFLDALAFAAFAVPGGEAEEGGGGRAADASVAVEEEEAALVGEGAGEVDDGAGVVGCGRDFAEAEGFSGEASLAGVIGGDVIAGGWDVNVVEGEVEAGGGLEFDAELAGAVDGDDAGEEARVGLAEEHGGFGVAADDELGRMHGDIVTGGERRGDNTCSRICAPGRD